MPVAGTGILYCCILAPCCMCLFLIFHHSYPLTFLWLSLMHPGTVHSVTMLQDCIAVGGHFFSAPMIKYSLYLIFHTFVGSNSITNVPTDDEQQMLLRIVLLWRESICKSTYLDRIEELGQGTLASSPYTFSKVIRFRFNRSCS